ncbi:MAG: TetR/AcrR family transcriptional regulator [Desulfobacteraceae bacterium]|nr:MAG: TetR/AcrR family transcriptional regulator [Desulfobacteraceae bacterium]
MSRLENDQFYIQTHGKASSAPAKKRLAKAMALLLQGKDFNSITTAEISRTASANEALIYRYFKDKRGLLHQVLHDYLLEFMNQVQHDLQKTRGAINKLRLLIQAHISVYDNNRVFAKILLLEARSFPGYFESETYRLVKIYGKMIIDIIQEGIEEGQIRSDIPAVQIRNLILGGIEHFCLAPVIFGDDIPVDSAAEQLSTLIFQGITTKSA